MKALKPFFGVLAVVGVVAVLFGVATIMQPKEIIPWRTDLTAAQEESRTSGKPLFLYFTAEWCGPCKALKHTTWADEAVNSDLRAYVPVKVDVDKNAEFSSSYTLTEEGTIIPTMVVVDRRNHVIKKHAGAMAPEEFRDWLTRDSVKETSDLAP